MSLDFYDYLDSSSTFLTSAENSDSETEKNSLLAASVIFSWIAIESFVNNMIDDFNQIPKDLFAMHERAFLIEKKLKFQDHGRNIGTFVVDSNQNDFKRLEDKIFFLIAKFSKIGDLRGGTLWQEFEKFKDLRNKLVHPRRDHQLRLDLKAVRRHQETSKKIINLISRNVWKKKIDF